MLPLIVVMPVFQMLLLSYAANYEVKNLAMSIVDHDLSSTSRQLTAKFQGNRHFIIREATFSQKEAMEGVANDKTI